MAFAEDLAPFFAEPTISCCTSCTIGGVSVDAVFSNRADETLYATGTAPVLTVASTAVSATARGTAAVVNGVAYTVAKIDHDGTGMAKVILERA